MPLPLRTRGGKAPELSKEKRGGVLQDPFISKAVIAVFGQDQMIQ